MVNKNNYKTSKELFVQSTEMFTPAPSPSTVTPPPIPPPATHHTLTSHSDNNVPIHPSPGPSEPVAKDTVEVEYKTLAYGNLGNPEVWGPAMWFSLHNGAARYPDRPSPFWRERMKYFILGIPVMVPCENCSNHAAAYIESKWDMLDNVVGCKQNLFQFFWEMHNYVNERLGKRIVGFDEAYNTYHSKVNVTKLEIK